MCLESRSNHPLSCIIRDSVPGKIEMIPFTLSVCASIVTTEQFDQWVRPEEMTHPLQPHKRKDLHQVADGHSPLCRNSDVFLRSRQDSRVRNGIALNE